VAGDTKESASIPYSGIVGAMFLAALVVVHHSSLDSARPPASEGKSVSKRYLHQDVDARLWQDPLAAVTQFRERERLEAIQQSQLRRDASKADASARDLPLPPDDRHNFEDDLKEWIDWISCTESVRLLLPMVRGGRSEEDAEMSRRIRYATVSGLMSSNFLPYEPESIGYAHLSWRSGTTADEPHLPEILPFEWYERRVDKATKKKDWVLVVWLDQSNFLMDPVARLRTVVDRLAPACKQDPKVTEGPYEATILGPVDSAILVKIRADIAGEIKSAASTSDKRAPNRLNFVSASATAPLTPEGLDPDLRVHLPSASQFYFASPNTTFARVVGPDTKLVDALVAEIKKRPHHTTPSKARKPAVVVISEHDTDYGREFSATVRDKAANYEVEAFSYLRQIDGGQGGGPKQAKSADRSKGSEKSEQQPRLRSHGASQIDYLDRLVRDIERYAEGDSNAAGGATRDIEAIAIFGNDVYDKLLILRAMKPAFPKALLLTTDLDARLLDAEEAEWARNLVVATNFDLTLSRKVQRGTAPFRDGYQTATYLAAWLFGGKCATGTMQEYHDARKIPPWLKEPLLFEIGRKRAIPLNSIEGGVISLGGCDFGPAEQKPLAKMQIQPSLEKPELDPAQKWLIAAGGVVVLGLLFWWARSYPASTRAGTPENRGAALRFLLLVVFVVTLIWVGVEEFWRTGDSQRIALVLPLGSLFAASLCGGLWYLREALAKGTSLSFLRAFLLAAPGVWLVVWATLPIFIANEEPFAWFEGISVWPTQLLRLLAAIFAIFSLWYIGSISANNQNTLGNDYGLPSEATPSPGSQGESITELWGNFVRRLSPRALWSLVVALVRRLIPRPKGESMADLWGNYARHRSTRILWTIGIAFAYLLICGLLMSVMDARPGIPARGDDVMQVAALLGFAVFMGVVLLVAMILACGAFIVDILWPAQALVPPFPDERVARFKTDHAMPAGNDPGYRRFIECVLAVDLVARRSQALIKLIYFPFAVFALMAIARSSVFDNWDTPVGLAIVLLLPFITVIGFVIWLRLETESFHKKALSEARAQLLRLHGLPDILPAHLWQLDKLFEGLREESRGSFQNLALQPIVRALLLPVGGLSGIEILEHLVLNR
jgi:hypothetical protein